MRFEASHSTLTIGATLLVTWCLSNETAIATPFVGEPVDSPGDVGRYTSLAIDASGNPGISYYDVTNTDLKYAHKSGSAWSLETVDTVGDVGQYTSLAFDSQGNPRISYYDNTNGDLKYASKSAGAWTLETVDAGGNVGQYTSIALDGSGNPSISYYDVTNTNLRYASKSGGIWTPQSADVFGAVGKFTSLALDPWGNPVISYYNETDGDLRTSRKMGGTWVIEAVDTVGDVGRTTSLVVDGAANLHVSYNDATGGSVKYARKSGAVWTFETVGPMLVGTATSLALDASDNPLIAYNNSAVMYAAKAGAVWTLEALDAGTFPIEVSLALDVQGNPRLGYYAASTNFLATMELKYSDSSVHLLTPSGGEVWPVGALRTISWSGSGRVDILLSADGGATFDLLRSSVQGSSAHNELPIRVPHLPTRFARLEIRRASPVSTAPSESLFTVEASIALLSFTATPPSESSPVVNLAWSTDPGPEDLSGYRLERRRRNESWQEVVALTRATWAQDPTGGADTAYRLTAMNGLGEEYVLGEVQLAPTTALAAWPLPYRAGDLTVSFATYGALGEGRAPAEVSVFDVAGRRVRTLASGDFADGYHRTAWDGKDTAGTTVSSGIYFVRARSGGREGQLKVVVVR